MTLDIIIHNGYVITMEGKGTGIINNGAVGIKRNKIIAVGTTHEVMHNYAAHRYIDAMNKVVMPGLVNTHMHTSNAIIRGLAQDIPYVDWRLKCVIPLLSFTTLDDLVTGSMLNIIESVKTGTTTFGDFDVPMIDLIQNHIQAGVRAVASDMINEMPKDVSVIEEGILYPLDSSVGSQKIQNNTRLIEQYHNSHNGRITCRYGVQAVDMCTLELLKEVKQLAYEYDVDIFMHVEQSEEEIEQSLLRYGKRPVALLDELGYLNERLLAAHLKHATYDEVVKVASSRASMALCSNSLVLINGLLPPAQEFMEAGGIVGLGTDQAPGNNCSNMFNEMKIAAMMHKYKNKDATAFPAWKVLRMATIEAAQALKMEDKVGSLKEGKLADIIIVDLMRATMCPIFDDPIRNVIPNLVFSARGDEVEMVIIDGKVIVEEHKILTVNELDIIKKANQAASRISQNLKQSKWLDVMQLAKATSQGEY